MRQFHAVVTGRVQGVCFRIRTLETAQRLNINGYAKNLPDRSVEVVAHGEEKKLQEFISYLHKGPQAAIVEDVNLTWDTNHPAPEPFTILY